MKRARRQKWGNGCQKLCEPSSVEHRLWKQAHAMLANEGCSMLCQDSPTLRSHDPACN